ncbi:MAG: TIGR02281 family clan AA aspartic protease [Sphingobium sp.]
MTATDQAMSSLWYVGAIVLVGSALVARRLPMNAVLRMALLWIGIFALLWAVFSSAEQAGWLKGQGVRSPGPPPGETQAAVAGGALRIAVSMDGHYWAEGTINGTPARFLIDSGASVTALSDRTARAAGLNMDSAGPPLVMTTANGKVEVQRTSIGTLQVGPIRASDLEAVVSPGFGDVNVIGMNLLSRLKSWGVRDGHMVLTP